MIPDLRPSSPQAPSSPGLARREIQSLDPVLGSVPLQPSWALSSKGREAHCGQPSIKTPARSDPVLIKADILQHLCCRGTAMANIRSLDDLNKDNEDSDDDAKHNDYYAGGAKRSLGLPSHS